jgi:hypothetical protein
MTHIKPEGLTELQSRIWDELTTSDDTYRVIADRCDSTYNAVRSLASRWKIRRNTRVLPPDWKFGSTNIPQEARAVRGLVRQKRGLPMDASTLDQYQRTVRNLTEMAGNYGVDKVVIRFNANKPGKLEFVKAREGIDEHLWWEIDPENPWRPWEKTATV